MKPTSQSTQQILPYSIKDSNQVKQEQVMTKDHQAYRKTYNMKHRNQNVQTEKGTWRKWIMAIRQGEGKKKAKTIINILRWDLPGSPI